MLAFILRRIGQAILVLLTVALISFSLFRFVGDPTQQMTSQDTTLEERLQIRKNLGLDDPVVVQFARFIGNAARFDFGVSYQNRQPVAKLIGDRFPATMELAFASAMFALLVGIPMGVYAGLKPNSWLARLFQTVSLVGISLPTFLIGILLIFIFSVSFGLLPSFGRQGVINLGFWSTGFLTWEGIRSLILPSITLGLFQMTLIMRLVRSEMMEVLRTDYVKFAKARGLTPRAVNYRHALKNTLIPVITITGLQLGSIIAFAIITETVFQWPGMGLMFLQAVQTVDIPIMSAYLLLVATLFVLINLIVDLLYALVDPRIRLSGKAA
ncbi:MAG: ABC transporter permease [Hyphomicrobiales bacterium]|jgi:peptide/nickel transport system permease protein|nr:ABC transporter permease [Hyphomicrobiales bacterium]